MSEGAASRVRRARRAARAGLLAAVAALATGCATPWIPFRPGPGAPGEERPQAVQVRPDAPAEYDLLVAQQLAHEGRVEEATEAYLRAVSKDDDSAYLHRRAAIALAQQNRLEEALLHARRALDLEPGDEQSRLFLGQIYRLRRESEAAEAVLRDASGDPVSPDAAFLLYQIYLDGDRFDRALAAARWLVERDPDSLRGRVALAHVYERLERPEEAERALRSALAQNPGELRLYSALARLLRQQKAFERETQLYEEVLERYPHHHSTLVALGEAQMALEDLEGAIATFQGVEERYPDDLQTTMRLGYLFFEMRRFEEARQRFDRVAAEQPGDFEVLFFLGLARRRSGDVQGSMEAFAAVPETHRYYGEARAQLASMYERRGEYGQALIEVERALEVRDSRDLELYAATLRAKAGQLEQAVADLQAMLAESPGDDELLFNLGVVYGEADRLDEAMSYMHQALDDNPANANALNYIGYTLAEQGIRLDEAERMVRRAIELRPDDGYIVDSLGWIYYMRARPLVESGRRGEAGPLLDRALHELQRAHDLTGGDPVISEHLGDIYLLMDQKKLALEKFEEALRLEPREAEQPDLREKLENLRRELH